MDARKTKVVRINGVATRWCWRDITYIVEGAGAHLDCIMIPKVHDASHVHFVAHLLTQLELDLGLEVGRIGLELQIETGHGTVKMEEIAAASPRAETIIFGPGDYAANLGIPQLTVGAIEHDYPGDQWHYINARIVNTARAYGLQAIDGPFAAIRDLDGMREVARARGCSAWTASGRCTPTRSRSRTRSTRRRRSSSTWPSRSSTPTASRPRRRAAARSCSTAR